MKRVVLDVPMFEFAVATRAALGAGAGLLLASRLSEGRRKAIGVSLLALGAASTIPAMLAFRRGIIRAGEPASALRSGR